MKEDRSGSAPAGVARGGAIGRLETAVMILLVSLLAWAFVRAAYCAFTHFKFSMVDYGLYVNSLWNTAHGRFFALSNDGTYLNRHLSFSLALLAPLFRVFDHPFMLSVVQTLGAAAGALLLWYAARRQAAPKLLAGLIGLWFLANPFTQEVLLAEFHGAALLLFGLPALYVTARFYPRWAWLPAAFVCGLREEAGLYAAGLLFYLAWQQRSRGLGVLGAAAVVYTALAVFVLFPWCAGMSLMVRRGGIPLIAKGAGLIRAELWPGRLLSLAYYFLPLLVLAAGAFRRWLAIAAFPLVFVMISFEPHQAHLRLQYGAAPIAAAGVFAVEAALALAARSRAGRWQGAAAVLLAAGTAATHAGHGFLPGGANHGPVYGEPTAEGRAALGATRFVRRDGLLRCETRHVGMLANRALIEVLKRHEVTLPLADVYFFEISDLHYDAAEEFRQVATNADYGVQYLDGDFAVLERGATGAVPRAQLQDRLAATALLRATDTQKHRGRTAYADGAGLCRSWPGSRKPEPYTLAFGRWVRLDAGTYRVLFRLRAESPPVRDAVDWGRLSVHRFGEAASLAEAPVDPIATRPGEFRMQELRLTLPEPARVEPRLTAGLAPLWADMILFVPVPPPGEAAEPFWIAHPPAVPPSVKDRRRGPG